MNIHTHAHTRTHTRTHIHIRTHIGPKITYHNTINIYLKYTKSSAKKETITYRNLKNINNENYTNDLYKLIILYFTIIILILLLKKYTNT